MWWKTNKDLSKPLRHLQERVEHLDDLHRETKKDLAETQRDVRTLDLDMGMLEDKFKALTGRVSVRKRKDREDGVVPEPELDLDQAIRDGVVTDWPR